MYGKVSFHHGNNYRITSAAPSPSPPTTTTTTQTHNVISKLNLPDLNDSWIWFVKKTFNVHKTW